MKKENLRIVFIALIIAMVSCSGRFYNRVITYDDALRNSSKKIVRVNVRSEEKRTEVSMAKIVFEKRRNGGRVFFEGVLCNFKVVGKFQYRE